MTNKFFAILLLFLSSLAGFAQESILLPAYNPVVAKQFEINKNSLKAAKVETDTIALPFYDDFSKKSVYPSQELWTDNYTFINNDFAKFPPTIGVATFDALDESGAIYSGGGPNPFDADYLTSRPIRLDSVFSPSPKALSINDKVYLSFYYQPQGRSVSPPSKNASLLLEFHSPGDNDTIDNGSTIEIIERWNEVWAASGGIKIDSFAKPDNRYFRQVLIPLTHESDTIYFKKGFQFRFRNIATLAGNSQSDWRNNGSNWNIDAVRLDLNRSENDTAIYDVAFAEPATSMLKSYESMPFRQYRKNFLNEMKENLNISISNLDNEPQNKVYRYDVRKNSQAPFKEYDGGSYNIEPFLTSGYSTFPAFATPPVNFFFPVSNEEKVVFHIIHTLTPDANPAYRYNDSTQFDQLFSNYYAYDNGTAEAGVGINGAAGSYAVQFKLNEADTLRGIQIFFNQVISGANQKLIDMNVWNDAFGVPGQVVENISGVTPLYTGSLNEFTTYWFENPVIVNAVDFPGLIFYIGWSQTFIENLNVGLDRRTDSHTKRFFNVDGNWQNSDSINYGSLMLRPIIGPVNPLGSGNENESAELRIYPNPVTNGMLNIDLPQSWKNLQHRAMKVNIFSANGSLVLADQFKTSTNVSALSGGLYFVVVTDIAKGKQLKGKILVR